jgi:hypothetical protein
MEQRYSLGLRGLCFKVKLEKWIQYKRAQKKKSAFKRPTLVSFNILAFKTINYFCILFIVIIPNLTHLHKL